VTIYNEENFKYEVIKINMRVWHESNWY
jgi:hypothetical protein